MKTVLFFGIPVSQHVFELSVLEFVPPTVRHFASGYAGYCRDEGEEGLVERTLNEIHRLVRKIVHTETLAPNRLAVAFQQGIEIMPPMP